MRGIFNVVSVDHNLADIAIRERFSLTSTEIERFYIMLREVLGLHEVLIVNTCNRIEIYFHHDKVNGEDVAHLLCTFKSINFPNHKPFINFIDGSNAINHLHRVAVGLESMVIGDLQIMGQIKQAYQLSVDHDMAGPMIHRLLHRVFYCHKLINQETTFKCGAASISYNAVTTVLNALSPQAKILVIGAGQMASDLVSHFVKKEYHNIIITNRSLDKAENLALEHGFDVIDFGTHKNNIGEYDAVISTITVTDIMYSAKLFDRANTQLIIDISSPRSVDPEVKNLPLAFLDIDALGNQVDTVIEKRKNQIPLVEQFIKDSVSDFEAWQEDFEFTSGIARFKSTLQELQRQSLASLMKNWSDQDKELAEQVTDAMIQKIINLPIKQMKSVCKREDAKQLSDSLNELFNIEYVNSVKL